MEVQVFKGEDKEQWLYETYQYTSNFDFNRLDKYEEANDDICIDDLILDYTMLYEFHKEDMGKIKRLNNIIKRIEKYLEDYDEIMATNFTTTIKHIIAFADIDKDSDKE